MSSTVVFERNVLFQSLNCGTISTVVMFGIGGVVAPQAAVKAQTLHEGKSKLLRCL